MEGSEGGSQHASVFSCLPTYLVIAKDLVLWPASRIHDCEGTPTHMRGPTCVMPRASSTHISPYDRAEIRCQGRSPPYDVDAAGDLKIWALGLLLGGHLSAHLAAGENHGHTLECQGKSMPKACGGMRNNACVML